MPKVTKLPWFRKNKCGGLLHVCTGVGSDRMMVDDACMDGTALDGIHVTSISLIQSFTEYHDNSCARLTALQNSRVGRGPQVRGGTKRATTGSLRQVWLSAGKKRSFSQEQARKLHEEMWANLFEKQGPLISGRWKSFRGVLLWWLVLHVLFVLLSHLGQVE